MNISLFLQTLPMAAQGMFGIFLVIFMIFVVIKLMNRIFK